MSIESPKPKILVILGATASGKSDLAVSLAERFNGEVISADSRQVYKGLDIGTGKITKREMRGIPHHLLDVVSPKTTYSVARYKKDAEKVVRGILSKKKLPIICGGTGFYIDTLLSDAVLPEVPPNKTLRAKLAAKSPAALFSLLTKLDPNRAKHIDRNNPVRLIRAVEIAQALGKVPERSVQSSKYDILKIGIDINQETLYERIHKRLLARMKKGMVREAKRLHKEGLSFKRMEELGLEYRYLAKYLNNKITKEEMLSLLEQEIRNYAKRQKTWFKRDKNIVWVPFGKEATINKTVKDFTKN